MDGRIVAFFLALSLSISVLTAAPTNYLDVAVDGADTTCRFRFAAGPSVWFFRGQWETFREEWVEAGSGNAARIVPAPPRPPDDASLAFSAPGVALGALRREGGAVRFCSPLRLTASSAAWNEPDRFVIETGRSAPDVTGLYLFAPAASLWHFVDGDTESFGASLTPLLGLTHQFLVRAAFEEAVGELADIDGWVADEVAPPPGPRSRWGASIAVGGAPVRFTADGWASVPRFGPPGAAGMAHLRVVGTVASHPSRNPTPGEGRRYTFSAAVGGYSRTFVDGAGARATHRWTVSGRLELPPTLVLSGWRRMEPYRFRADEATSSYDATLALPISTASLGYWKAALSIHHGDTASLTGTLRARFFDGALSGAVERRCAEGEWEAWSMEIRARGTARRSFAPAAEATEPPRRSRSALRCTVTAGTDWEPESDTPWSALHAGIDVAIGRVWSITTSWCVEEPEEWNDLECYGENDDYRLRVTVRRSW